MSNQEPKVLPSLSEDKGIKSTRHIPETVSDSVGCKHDFQLKGYEAECQKCGLGLFVRSYKDFLDLTKKMDVLDS